MADESAVDCYDCNTTFTSWRRKHRKSLEIAVSRAYADAETDQIAVSVDESFVRDVHPISFPAADLDTRALSEYVTYAWQS